ncbi:MAG TPA: anti-sigma factor [Actinomycetes bacterium]|nr:anti-sigma factor [Actinomycetes bacterium]
MTDPELHTLTGAYAADALEPDERDRFERHLAACADCRQEVAELRATTARLAGAAFEQPPADLRARVLDEVSRTRQQPPLTDDNVVPLTAKRWWRQPASAAAALLLVVSAGLGALAWQQDQRADDAEARAAQIAAVVTDPDRVESNAPATTGGSGTVVAAEDLAVFRTEGLPELPSDQDYQLWVISDDGATSAGVLGRDGDLEQVVEGVADADALGLTVEPSGGSDAPTGDLVLQLPLQS